MHGLCGYYTRILNILNALSLVGGLAWLLGWFSLSKEASGAYNVDIPGGYFDSVNKIHKCGLLHKKYLIDSSNRKLWGICIIYSQKWPFRVRLCGYIAVCTTNSWYNGRFGPFYINPVFFLVVCQ